MTRIDLAGTRLLRSPFLSENEAEVLDRAAAAVRTVGANVGLLSEGKDADCLYILRTGWAYRYKTTRDGQRQMPALLLPGDVCNLDGLLLGAADYGIRTLTPATVLTVPLESALALGAAHVGIARTFTWLAFVENAILSQWALCLGRQTARQRLAHLLCEIGVRLDAMDADGQSRFELPLTQEQLADVLGLTSVHVNRTMQQLRAEGLVVTRGRLVTVPSAARLCAVGEFDHAYLHDDRAAAPMLLPQA